MTLNDINKVGFIPHCFDCRSKLILTEFENGVVRFLCPDCGKKLFVINKDGCAVKASIFEITEAQGYFDIK